MIKYKNLSRDSGVDTYEFGNEYIKVKFENNSRIYVYSYSKAGRVHVDKMKIKAESGKGLQGYINQYVKNLFDLN